MIIIGIDPGTASTGYGVVRKTKTAGSAKENPKTKSSFQCLDYGVIQTDPALSPAERLKILNQKLNKVIKKHKPGVLAIENVYFFKNLKTALPVSQAKGVILFTAAKKGLPVYEFTPLQVKLAITGYGWAEKKQVQIKVKTLLKLKELPKPDDAADALALAICYGKSVKGVA